MGAGGRGAEATVLLWFAIEYIRISYSIHSYLSKFFYVYHPIVGKVQLAAPIRGMADGWRELALVRPFVIPFIENRRFCQQ